LAAINKNRRGTIAGIFYRTAVRIKEFGERHNLPWLIRLGLAIRNAL
jgi:hypothetical protein